MKNEKMDYRETYLKIRESLQARRDDFIRELIALTEIPSVEGPAAPGAPFGTGCREALEAVERLTASYGYRTEPKYDHGYLLAYAGNLQADRTIGVFSHADVVPAGEAWTLTQPFRPIEKDGFVIGRGVADNKEAVLMGLFAAHAIETLRLPLHSRLLLCTGSNEETGMLDMRAFAENETMPNVSLVPDNGFPVCRGERGIFRFWAQSGDVLSDAVISATGGEAFNVLLAAPEVTLRYSPALKTFLAAEAEKNDNLTLSHDTGNGTLSLRAWGETCHASVPGDAVHGAYRVAEVLSRCPALPAGDRAVFATAAELTRDCYGGGMGIASVDPEFGKLTCVNGMIATDGGHLRLSFDVRYGTSWDARVLEETAAARLSSLSWHLYLHENDPGFSVPAASPFVQTLLSVFRDCTGQKNAQPYLSSGGTYARCLRNAFSMGDTHRTPPFPIPSGHGYAHQPDELLPIDEALDATAVIAAMILACDNLLWEGEK